MTTMMKEKKNARYIVRALKPSFLPAYTQETQDNVFTQHFVLNALVIYLSESIFFLSHFNIRNIIRNLKANQHYFRYAQFYSFFLVVIGVIFHIYIYFSLTEHVMWSLLILCQA